MPCHTAPGGKPFAGGLGLSTPFGVIHSSNITPDLETGIGSWRFDDFAGALHQGVRKDGAYLYPAMPFDAYSGITRADLEALWVYFQTIEPVRNVPPANSLEFPFNVRLGLAFWRELYFHPAPLTVPAGKSADYARGAYLVEALGHCTECHTPRTLLGGLEPQRRLTGAAIDHWFAPDISTDRLSGIASWSTADLVQFLKTGSNANKTTAFGPMAEVVHDSLAYLTDADLQAMAIYLKDLPPPGRDTRSTAAAAMPAERYAAGQKLYVDNCLTCHQPKGAGLAGVAPALAGNTAVTAAQPYNPVMVVLEGIPAAGGWGAMPSFAARLGDQQIADLVGYVRTSWGNEAAPAATAGLVAAWRRAATLAPIGDAAATSFGCPDLAAGTSDPTALQSLARELASGDEAGRTVQVVARWRADSPGSSLARTVDAFATAYCPTVAAGSEPAAQKRAILRAFVLRVTAVATADAAGSASDGSAAAMPIVWATPVGKTLVGTWPPAAAGPLTCPTEAAAKLGPAAGAAAGLLGRPVMPPTASEAAQLAARLHTAQPSAAPATVANALIWSYCQLVTQSGGVSDAERRARVDGFASQVIQALQTTTSASGARWTRGFRPRPAQASSALFGLRRARMPGRPRPQPGRPAC